MNTIPQRPNTAVAQTNRFLLRLVQKSQGQSAHTSITAFKNRNSSMVIIAGAQAISAPGRLKLCYATSQL